MRLAGTARGLAPVALAAATLGACTDGTTPDCSEAGVCGYGLVDAGDASSSLDGTLDGAIDAAPDASGPDAADSTPDAPDAPADDAVADAVSDAPGQ